VPVGFVTEPGQELSQADNLEHLQFSLPWSFALAAFCYNTTFQYPDTAVVSERYSDPVKVCKSKKIGRA
jgi:hypothetical protein